MLLNATPAASSGAAPGPVAGTMPAHHSYVTVLSNWLAGYDRYRRIYSKANIAQSTYPDEFYLLRGDFAIGVAKATALLEKVAVPGNQVVRIDTDLDPGLIRPNTRNGRGFVAPVAEIPVAGVHLWHSESGSWRATTVEEVTAAAFKLADERQVPWEAARPLTLSFLPIARACQASCLFCFSESSLSREKTSRAKDFSTVEAWCTRAQEAGAERFVLTGGGEPTLLPFPEVQSLISIAGRHFDKTVLITNGKFLSADRSCIAERLRALRRAGLDVLSLSRHHHDHANNTRIMGTDIAQEAVMEVWSSLPVGDRPDLRLVCVLQTGGVDDHDSIGRYLAAAASYGVTQVCFKELYVASTHESLYATSAQNQYSASHQVPLARVLSFMEQNQAPLVGRLPWGAPLFRHGAMTVAAYTEPSVGWERANGIVRSWNLMADLRCYASLEDQDSEIHL